MQQKFETLMYFIYIYILFCLHIIMHEAVSL